MATHSSILAWRVPRTEEPSGLQSIGSQRVGDDLVTEHTHACTRLLWRNVCLDHLPFFYWVVFVDIELYELFVYFRD